MIFRMEKCLNPDSPDERILRMGNTEIFLRIPSSGESGFRR
jgi:hypothetical protein